MPGTTQADADPPSKCADTPYAVQLRAASGDATGIELDSFEVVSAKAVRLADGAAYTIYLADFPISDDDISAFSQPEVPDDGAMVTLFLTTFNAPADPQIITAGTTIDYTPDFGVLTFRVVAQVGTEQFGSLHTAQGTVTVDEAGDYICGTVEYTDSASEDLSDVQNRLKGQFSAEVVAGF